MTRYEHITLAFEKEFKQTLASIQESIHHHCFTVLVRDLATDRQHHAMIDTHLFRTSGEEAIIEALKGLGKRIERDRTSDGRLPATGEPIFKAGEFHYGGIVPDVSATMKGISSEPSNLEALYGAPTIKKKTVTTEPVLKADYSGLKNYGKY